MNLTNLDPYVIFLGNKFINMLNVDHYTVDYKKLYIIFDYGNALKDVILFATPEELEAAVTKIEKSI